MPHQEDSSKKKESRAGRREPEQSERITGNEGRAEAIERLIDKIHKQLQQGKGKATVNDFIKLLQLQREVRDEQPKEITVRWVEPVSAEA